MSSDRDARRTTTTPAWPRGGDTAAALRRATAAIPVLPRRSVFALALRARLRLHHYSLHRRPLEPTPRRRDDLLQANLEARASRDSPPRCSWLCARAVRR